MMDQPTGNKRAVFLDRDGTLNRDLGFVHRVADLELLDQAVAGLARIAALGFQLLITTNQSGVARGYFTESDMHAFNQALCRRLAERGITIAAVYCCVFHPTEGIGPYRCDSPLRKPQAGMIRKAAAEHGLDLGASFAIGDKIADVLAGRAAGCRTILLSPPAAGEQDGQRAARPDFVAANLVEAAQWIERAGAAAAGMLPAAGEARLTGQTNRSAHSEFLH